MQAKTVLLIGSLGVVFLTGLAETASLAAEPSKSNIILIFADDLGWKDVGYQGK